MTKQELCDKIMSMPDDVFEKRTHIGDCNLFLRQISSCQHIDIKDFELFDKKIVGCGFKKNTIDRLILEHDITSTVEYFIIPYWNIRCLYDECSSRILSVSIQFNFGPIELLDELPIDEKKKIVENTRKYLLSNLPEYSEYWNF